CCRSPRSCHRSRAERALGAPLANALGGLSCVGGHCGRESRIVGGRPRRTGARERRPMSSARMCFVFFVSLTGLAAGAGCTAQSTTSGTDGSAGGDAAATVSPEAGSTSDGATNADGSAAPTTKPATCLAIFDCVAGCNSDQPCADACVQSAPPDAQTQAVALAQCSTDANCNDDACVQSQCSPSLDACVQGGMPAPGQPIDGSVPAGVVPPQLVGTWAYAAWGSSTTFTFNADGTGTYTFAPTGDVTGCN